MNLRAITAAWSKFTNGQQPIRTPSGLLRLDFPRCLAREYPDVFPVCWESIESILRAIENSDLSPLQKRSPALKGYDWSTYLKCSAVRMVRALTKLRSRVPSPANVLDMGSYFGNFSLMLSRGGYSVDAADSYCAYESAFDSVARVLKDSGIHVRELTDALPEDYYDAVLLMGVIEHIPHTPRFVLEAANRALQPGGYLIIDTPNLAYIYNRQKLSRGESPFYPIAAQYFTERPFEGHHREYTIDEVRWLLQQLQHEEVVVETFSYSIYSTQSLAGEDLQNYLAMEKDPSCREVIFTISRKPFLV